MMISVGAVGEEVAMKAEDILTAEKRNCRENLAGTCPAIGAVTDS